MRPDPWQQEKSRKYQLKHKAKLLSKAQAKTRSTKDSKEKAACPQNPSVSGFKFVNPVQISTSNVVEEGQSEEGEEDEYDIVDFNAVNRAEVGSILTGLELNETSFKGLVLRNCVER